MRGAACDQVRPWLARKRGRCSCGSIMGSLAPMANLDYRLAFQIAA
eukprot:COSAG01_NODE_1381_length_10520_cov_2.661710_13_plen_46_part_00